MQRLEQEQVNANEIADKLEQGHWEGGTREQAATMLRQQQEKLTKYELRHVAQRDRIAILEMQHKQQQAEIEALKKEAALQRLSDFTQEADNEPVAWFEQDKNMKSIWYQCDKGSPNAIPLYTHPAKTLTDEEIEEVYRTVEQDFYLTESKKPDGGWRNFPVELGRAILRKAQEK